MKLLVFPILFFYLAGAIPVDDLRRRPPFYGCELLECPYGQSCIERCVGRRCEPRCVPHKIPADPLIPHEKPSSRNKRFLRGCGAGKRCLPNPHGDCRCICAIGYRRSSFDSCEPTEFFLKSVNDYVKALNDQPNGYYSREEEIPMGDIL